MLCSAHLWQGLYLGQVDVDIVVGPLLLEVGAEELLEAAERRPHDVVGRGAELAALAEAVELELEHDAGILLRPLLELDAVPTVEAAVHLCKKRGLARLEKSLCTYFVIFAMNQ